MSAGREARVLESLGRGGPGALRLGENGAAHERDMLAQRVRFAREARRRLHFVRCLLDATELAQPLVDRRRALGRGDFVLQGVELRVTLEDA